MSKANDGGPAYPSTYTYTDRDGDVCSSVDEGVTVRDYFAAKIISGMMADPNLAGTYETIAAGAYHLADIMLLERAK